MLAVQVHAFDGRPESVRVESIAVPKPAHGEVLIRIAAAPINPSDLHFVDGRYGFRKPTPATPGFEGSGTVVASGGGLYPRWLVGKRVACGIQTNPGGTWAEYLATSARFCVPLPKWVSLEQASMTLVNPMTVIALLETARRGGHAAAIHAPAAGALGRMLARVSEASGFPIIHVVRRSEHVTLLGKLGARHVLDSTENHFDERLRELAAELDATIAFDAVSGDLTGRLLAAMPRGSRLLVYGLLASEPCAIDAHQFVFENKHVDGFLLSDWFANKSLASGFAFMRRVHRLLDRDFNSEVAERVPLTEASRAMQAYRNAMSRGKVLLVPGDEV